MMQHYFNHLYFFDGSSKIHKKVFFYEYCNISHFCKKDFQTDRKGRVAFSLD